MLNLITTVDFRFARASSRTYAATGAIISVTNPLGTYEAPRADVRVDRWNLDCPAQVDRVSVPGSRTFDRNLRRADRGDLCRSWHLARPQANRKTDDNCCEGGHYSCRGPVHPGRT